VPTALVEAASVVCVIVSSRCVLMVVSRVFIISFTAGGWMATPQGVDFAPVLVTVDYGNK
jgi:hypothetical protein